jgi:putative SOS response-associated peptidase YedK
VKLRRSVPISCSRPYPADDMKMWPVDKRIGNVRNNDPSLIEPSVP